MSVGMAKRGVNFLWPVESQALCRRAIELLKDGHCQRAAELLRQARVTSERTGDAMTTHILDAAHRVCLACSECRAEAEWHGRAHAEVQQRESELRQELHVILDLISGRGTEETPDKHEEPFTFSRVEMSQPERDPKAPVKRISLLQRIKALMERPGLRPPGRESPIIAVETSAEPSVETAKTPVKPIPVSESEGAVVSTVGNVQMQKHGDPPSKQKNQEGHSLVIHCLGPFRVFQDHEPVDGWPNCKGKSVFKYMLTHRDRPVPKEVIMETFWPNAEPSAARNNLNVAIYDLRKVLSRAGQGCSHVLFKDDCYLFKPELEIWIDYEAFTEHFTNAQALEQRRKMDSAIREYSTAEALYLGEFLEDDRYEDWVVPLRQTLQDNYLVLLDRLSRYYFDDQDYNACVTVCNKMLAVDTCREDAHCQLMRCYSRQGHPHLALRQYHLCVETLEREFDIAAGQSTRELFEQIRRRQPV